MKSIGIEKEHRRNEYSNKAQTAFGKKQSWGSGAGGGGGRGEGEVRNKNKNKKTKKKKKKRE